MKCHRSGITSFKDLFIVNKLASFEQLCNKVLPASHFFRYLQARPFIHSHIPGSGPAPESTLLETILQLNPTNRGLTSLLYNKM